MMYKLKSFIRRNNLLLLILTVFLLGMAVMAVFDTLIRFKNYDDYKQLAHLSEINDTRDVSAQLLVSYEMNMLSAFELGYTIAAHDARIDSTFQDKFFEMRKKRAIGFSENQLKKYKQ